MSTMATGVRINTSQRMVREDRMLVDALRQHAAGGKRPAFPFDDLKFTLEQAAATIERQAQAILAKQKEEAA